MAFQMTVIDVTERSLTIGQAGLNTTLRRYEGDSNEWLRDNPVGGRVTGGTGGGP